MRRFLPLLVLAGSANAMPALAEPAARVTSAGPEYCADLLARVANTPAARSEPHRTLAADGGELCAAGHTRSGVIKLRRALKGALAP